MKDIHRYAALGIATLGLAAMISSTQAGTLPPIHRFTNDFSGNADGAFQKAGVIINSQGALYGTTNEGGDFGGYGTVFKLAPSPNGPTAWGNTPRSTVSARHPTASTVPTPRPA